MIWDEVQASTGKWYWFWNLTQNIQTYQTNKIIVNFRYMTEKWFYKRTFWYQLILCILFLPSNFEKVFYEVCQIDLWNKIIRFQYSVTNTAFTHAGLKTRYREKSLNKSIVARIRRYIVYEEDRKPAKTCRNKMSYKTWKSVFTNVRFRPWSSKPLSVNAE